MNEQPNEETRRSQEERPPLQIRVDNILEFLRANPHLGAQSKDDVKCKALFAELGMLDMFPKAQTPTFFALAFPGHPTHWIIGVRWCGYLEPRGNGYGVFCLPKMLVPAEEVNDIVKDLHRQQGGHDLQTGELRLPYNWRTRQ